jgi:hypothetical protein
LGILHTQDSCYDDAMSKTAAKSTERKMEYVEITQAEEMPVLSAKEKAELLQSLKDAEARLARGEYVEFKGGEFGQWVRERMAFHRSKLRL